MSGAGELQAFLYRGVTTNGSVRQLVEDGVLASGKVPATDDGGGGVLDEFDVDKRVAAKRMGRIYELLYCLENSMRELIERTLRESDDLIEWTDGIDPGILGRARKREQEDKDARWHGPRGGTILSYLDFPDLGRIILDRWDDFQDLLGDRRWVEAYFQAINPSRRALAHTGELTDFDVERMEMRVREWLMVAG